ncbi:transglutaminase domain-containing protein [Candidatus Woesearchaeota archaeon]|nr:transglutaminase domain-containing protein [Candidatus Woesearchaeota archaeon]
MDSQNVEVDIEISSGVRLERESGSVLDYLQADVGFIPLETDSQEVLSISSDPYPESTTGGYVFRWEEPVSSNPDYSIFSKVRTTNVFHDVRRITFPYRGFPDDVEQFLLPAETIDSDNPSVILKGSELAKGETDYYKVVFNIADWVKETVEYDLSTLNVKASNKASAVLLSQDGVCDEITTLFIALLRSIGIPARFVSGIAYTDAPEFPENWGAHGWAEVYFPGTGWVPFDVTYGQYGFVDPTHVKLKESFDSGESDVKYEWVGRGVDVVAKPIVLSADLVSSEGKVPDNVILSVSSVQDVVGPGSYNLIEAVVENKRSGYVSDFIFIANVDELELDGANYRSVVLGPKETVKVHWLVRVSDDLDSRFTYTFPVSISNLKNSTAESEFLVVPREARFSRATMEEVAEASKKGEDKRYSKSIHVDFSQPRDIYYTYDYPVVEALVKNTGNFPFKSIKFCMRENCTTEGLAISQERIFNYSFNPMESDTYKLLFTMRGDGLDKDVFYDLKIWDVPSIEITDIKYPQSIGFRKPFNVSFKITKSSISTPSNVSMNLFGPNVRKEVNTDYLDVSKKFIFEMSSESLSTEPNNFTINLDFKDENDRQYNKVDWFVIDLVDVSFGDRLLIFLYDIDRWLRNLFK